MAFLWVVALLVCVTQASLMDYHMGYDDIQTYGYHPCKRPCEDNEPAMKCEFDFLVEHYYTLAKACYDCPMVESDCFRPHCVPADGSPRGIMTVNRMMPGPAIHVCEGDTIRVRVHNKLDNGEGVTIHWHGILQTGTPHMDGVAMVTQCSIPSHTAFTYTFKAENPGTHFWHAHSGMQRADGVFGHLVIRQPPSKEVHFSNYDLDIPDHAMMVNDWWEESVASHFSHHHHSDGTNKPTSMLINGKGMYKVYYDPKTGLNTTTPREVFTVREGYKYRFRVVSNGILDCPIRISVDDHMLWIIATDGNPVEPMEVESFTMFDGERYDFILHADKPVSNYLVRARGLSTCSAEHNDAFQTAILRYEGALIDNSLNTPFPELKGIELNPMNTKQTDTKLQVTELKSLKGSDPTLTRKPDKQFVVAMDFYAVNDPRFHNEKYYPVQKVERRRGLIYPPQMNHISMILPPAPPLTQMHDIPKDLFCNNDTRPQDKDCVKEFCECAHLLKVDIGDVVEVILLDEGKPIDANHPIHLHGHHFRVVAMDRLGKSTSASIIKEMDKAGNITRNLDRPPIKDTVTVPDGGYSVIRFHANNPGVWFFHCHILYHSEIGMGLIFQVGDVWEFPRRPARFPQCGSWDGYDKDKLWEEEERKREDDEERKELRERVDRLERMLEQNGDGDHDEGHRMHAGILTVVLCGVLYLVL